MDGKKTVLLLAALFFVAAPARAARVEISGMAAYGKNNMGDGYTTLQRRYSGSVEFKFTSVSAIQFEYMDSMSKYTSPVNVGTLLPKMTEQLTVYRDRVYSFNWVQNLVPSDWIIQPYVVFGGGKLKRKVRQEQPEFAKVLVDDTQSSTSGTAGAGLRIFFLKNMALKAELKTYVPDFKFSKWKDNQMLSAGLSFLF